MEQERSVEARAKRAAALAAAAVSEDDLLAQALARRQAERVEWERADEEARERIRAEGEKQLHAQVLRLEVEARQERELQEAAQAQARQHARAVRERAAAEARTRESANNAAGGAPEISAHDAWAQPYWQALQDALLRAEAEANAAAFTHALDTSDEAVAC